MSKIIRSKFIKQSPKSKFPTLLIFGPDKKGIVAAYSQIFDRYNCNIIQSEQWTDRQISIKQRVDGIQPLFCQRTLLDCSLASQRITPDKKIPSIDNNGITESISTLVQSSQVIHPERKSEIEYEINKVSKLYGLEATLNWRDKPKNLVIMTSKYDHCLWEILLRHKENELYCNISAIISNHTDLQYVADSFEIPYHYIPITPESKQSQEEEEIDLLKNIYRADVIVLARYMQVLTPHFLSQFAKNQIINIHHSFLPAFMGSKPYDRAHERGVKLIGATAHYVTQDLDEGPIIEQDVIQVSHRDDIPDLRRKGRIIERNVLFNALQAHLDDRVISYNNKCVVFSDSN
jgi:formyltetrahydrofolate deformylase